MKKFLSLITILLMSFISISQTQPSNVDKQIIVAPKKGHDREFNQFVGNNNLKVLQKFDQLGWYVIEVPSNETQNSFIEKHKGHSSINKMYKNEEMVYSRDYVPNDSQFGSQWFLKQISDKDIDADQAWDSLPSNNAPVTVAVFDGGNDITHEDLLGNIVTPFNAVTNSPSNGALIDAQYDRHGTACSGTIAAVTNNGTGVSSVGNNKVKVMPINIMTYITSGGQFGTSTTIQINAINAAMANNCVAISMSYGGSGFSQALSDAFTVAKNQGRGGKGIFICGSTGNNGSGSVTQYPASYSAVYGIGATTSADSRASFSNYGNIVDISAPGATILTTDLTGVNGYSTGNYASVSGTSFSCPITAACGAVLMYKNPNLTEAQVMSVLAQTAEKVGGYTYALNGSYPLSTRCVELGYGRVNLYAAVMAVPSVGNPIDNPPAEQHNIVVINCGTSNSAPNLGSTITLTTTQKTTAPALAAIAPKVQYRFSNDNVWSSDDLIIGADTSNIGNGVESEVETINFTIPSSSTTGVKYILIRANYDNAITETTSVDNTCSLAITLTNPGSTGLDLQAFWMYNSVVTCGVNTSIGGGAVGTTTYRFKNTGAVPITTFTARARWENCPWAGLPSYVTCNLSTLNYTTAYPALQPNGLTGTWTFNACLANCGLSSNPYTILNVGETRNIVLEILTVNGQTSDDFAGNNIALLPVTRTTCSTATIDGVDVNFETEEVVPVAEPVTKIYTITGVLVNNIPFDQLASGIYIVRTTFPDGSVETRKIFK